jgi:hypothetical protein
MPMQDVCPSFMSIGTKVVVFGGNESFPDQSVQVTGFEVVGIKIVFIPVINRNQISYFIKCQMAIKKEIWNF